MPDESTAASTIHCPWCSTESPAGTTTCPSCGAALIASGEGALPGLTAIDTEAVLRTKASAKSRGGILGFFGGDSGDKSEVPSEKELESLAPPKPDVQIEMVRLELEAQRQRIEAEAGELQGELVLEEAEERGANGATAMVSSAPSAAAAPSATVATPPPGPAPAPEASSAEEPPPGP
ncbi:MAG: hypothetical protein ACHQ3P_03050 [Candidatus Limnocylindrales bacterium]